MAVGIGSRHGADVAIIGYGLVGSVVARCLLEAGARVVLIDAGSPLSAVPGTHIRNLAACRADRSFHYDLVRASLRPASLRPPTGNPLGPTVPPMPEGNGVNQAQRVGVNLPAARVTNLTGGMGAVWNCVAPRLDPHLEQWPGIPQPEWDSLYDRAESLLHVGARPAPSSPRQEFLLRELAMRYPVGPRPAPVAARWTEQPAARCWTGPAEVLADAGERAGSSIDILAQHAVHRLRQRGGRVITADTVDLGTGASRTIEADTFVVAAGAIRTPALLWASEIGTGDGERTPLGRYLYDHPLAHAQLVLDPELLGTGPDPDPFVVIPVSADRLWHALLLCDGYDAGKLEGCVDERLILSLYWYAIMQPRYENRVRFTGPATDAVGLPQPTFEYSLGPEDHARHQAALDDLRAAGRQLGTFLPTSPPRKLSAGSSMHVMGTTRIGRSDDGHSVADPYGRVWGCTNLYIGGTGLIPSATATNPTLAACAIAVRTADRIIEARRTTM